MPGTAPALSPANFPRSVAEHPSARAAACLSRALRAAAAKVPKLQIPALADLSAALVDCADQAAELATALGQERR